MPPGLPEISAATAGFAPLPSATAQETPISPVGLWPSIFTLKATVAPSVTSSGLRLSSTVRSVSTLSAMVTVSGDPAGAMTPPPPPVESPSETVKVSAGSMKPSSQMGTLKVPLLSPTAISKELAGSAFPVKSPAAAWPSPSPVTVTRHGTLTAAVWVPPVSVTVNTASLPSVAFALPLSVAVMGSLSVISASALRAVVSPLSASTSW